MKILVDARLLHGGGIGRFLRHVTGRWLREPKVSEIRFLGRLEELDPWLADEDQRGVGRSVSFPYRSYSLRAQMDWAMRAGGLRGEADVAFFPHYDIPLVRHPRPSVVVVHDLTHYVLPEAFPRGKRIAGKLLLDGALDRGDRVVTVSKHSRSDLIRWKPDLEGRMKVVYPGVDRIFQPLSDPERSRADRRWAHLTPFLLMVGSDRPHKNLAMGPRILAGLSERWPSLKLVVVGTRPDRPGRLAAVAAQEGVRDRTVELGIVDDASLRELYGLATVLLFPSLYEGFGLPPLEAMACGTAVMASDRGAVPEVLDGHGILLDPEDPAHWIRRLGQILGSGSRRPAGGSVAHETKHAMSFSWDRTAGQIFEIICHLAGEGPVRRDPGGR